MSHLINEKQTNEDFESGLAFGNFSGDDGIAYTPLDAPRSIGVDLEMHV